MMVLCDVRVHLSRNHSIRAVKSFISPVRSNVLVKNELALV